MSGKRIFLLIGALSFLGVAMSCSREPSSTGTETQALAEPEGPPEEERAEERTPLSSAGSQAEESHEHPELVVGTGPAHQDHDPKHGGTFFMALDGIHHLEGVLVPPGVFRAYIYDEHTLPVGRARLEQMEASVIWGEQDGAPEIRLQVSADGDALEAMAPGPVRFPVTLTLLVRFPGAAPGARRELFTFPFSHYTHPPDHRH